MKSGHIPTHLDVAQRKMFAGKSAPGADMAAREAVNQSRLTRAGSPNPGRFGVNQTSILNDVMKSRRKFELLIDDIRRSLLNPAQEDRYGHLFHSTWDLVRFKEDIAGDIGKAALLLAVARLARETTGAGRGMAEEKIMDCIEAVVRIACERLENSGVLRIPDRQAIDTLDASVRQSGHVIGRLCDYAMDCLRYKAVARDQNAGLRRGLAYQILAAATVSFELTAVLDFARQALSRNRSQEVRGAIVFLEDYFKMHADMPMPDDIANSLLAVAEKTDSRSTATGALNVLVETGDISEFEALDRISEWKEKHYHRTPE